MKNNKVIFWLLSLTWGLPMTLVGAAAALILALKSYVPTRWGPCWVFVVGEGWGGINLGPVIIISKTSKIRTIYHEIGHALQNCLWGPLFPFVIAIPSAIRYQLREREELKNKVKFSSIFDIALIVISVVHLILLKFNFLNMFVTLLLFIIDLYLILIDIWLTFKEIPKYEITIPSYDDIWFEGQATRWGIEFMDNEKE